MIYSKGDVSTDAAHTIDQRMRRHGPGTFYSDHAAVVADLTIGTSRPGATAR